MSRLEPPPAALLVLLPFAAPPVPPLGPGVSSLFADEPEQPQAATRQDATAQQPIAFRIHLVWAMCRARATALMPACRLTTRCSVTGNQAEPSLLRGSYGRRRLTTTRMREPLERPALRSGLAAAIQKISISSTSIQPLSGVPSANWPVAPRSL